MYNFCAKKKALSKENYTIQGHQYLALQSISKYNFNYFSRYTSIFDTFC